MALDIYTNCAVDIRGQRLLEAADVSVERQSNSQEQKTLQKGWAGESPGAPIMMIKITNAVKADGFEYDAGPDIAGLVAVPFTIWAANSFLTSEGIIQSDAFTKAVDKNATVEVTIKTKMAQWQAQ